MSFNLLSFLGLLSSEDSTQQILSYISQYHENYMSLNMLSFIIIIIISWPALSSVDSTQQILHIYIRISWELHVILSFIISWLVLSSVDSTQQILSISQNIMKTTCHLIFSHFLVSTIFRRYCTTNIIYISEYHENYMSVNPCSPEGFSQTYFPKGGCCNPPSGLSILKVI